MTQRNHRFGRNYGTRILAYVLLAFCLLAAATPSWSQVSTIVKGGGKRLHAEVLAADEAARLRQTTYSAEASQASKAADDLNLSRIAENEANAARLETAKQMHSSGRSRFFHEEAERTTQIQHEQQAAHRQDIDTQAKVKEQQLADQKFQEEQTFQQKQADDARHLQKEQDATKQAAETERQNKLAFEEKQNLKGTNSTGTVANRSKFRKSTVQQGWDNASSGPTGGRLCPTCNIEVKVPPNSGQSRDWDLNHTPPWTKREFPPDVTRKEVIDNYQKGVELECPNCNRPRGNKEKQLK